MADTEYVIDTEPILAYLYDEPGHEAVATVIEQVHAGETTAAVAEANAAEVLYKVARFEGEDDRPTAASLRMADRDIRALERLGVALRCRARDPLR